MDDNSKIEWLNFQEAQGAIITRVALYFWFFFGCVFAFKLEGGAGHIAIFALHTIFYGVRLILIAVDTSQLKLVRAQQFLTSASHNVLSAFWDSLKLYGVKAEFQVKDAAKLAAKDATQSRLDESFFTTRLTYSLGLCSIFL